MFLLAAVDTLWNIFSDSLQEVGILECNKVEQLSEAMQQRLDTKTAIFLMQNLHSKTKIGN